MVSSMADLKNVFRLFALDSEIEASSTCVGLN